MEYVVFLALVPVALALLAAVCVTTWRRRHSGYGRALFVLSLLCAGWVTSNALEVVLPTPAATYRFAQLTYFFAAAAPVAWLAFAWVFTGQAFRLRSWLFRWIVLFHAATVLVVFTNPAHGLIWRAVTYVPVYGMLGMRVTYGPWFYPFALHCWLLIGAGSLLIVREYYDAYRSTRRLSAYVAFGALIPAVLNVVHVAHLVPSRKDFTPLGTSAAAVLIAVGLHRYRLLRYRPVARRVLIEGMQEGMLVLDEDDRIVDVNPAFLRMLPLAGDPLGRPAAALLPPEALGALDAGSAEVALHGPEGLRHYSVRVSPLTGRRGAPAGRLVLLHDITERRAANTALEARNEDLDAFARMVAHDLKNPIHAVHGYAEVLLDAGDEMAAEARAACVEAILRTSQKMDGIVQALLLLAGVNRQTVTPAPVETGKVVARALDRLAPLVARTGATIETPEPWPDALGYAPWIEEVWMNYLTNALKYGGHPPRLRLGADTPAHGQVRFYVRDAGPGIPPAAQARLFQPFARVGGETEEGHGLGLSIVRRIVERLGGTVGVESTGVAGEGTLFYFTLPVVPEAQRPARTPALHTGVQ